MVTEGRFLDDIKTELEAVFGHGWSGENGLKKIVKQIGQNPKYLREKMGKAVECVNKKVENIFKKMAINEPRVLVAEKTRKAYGKLGSGEELLERLITISNMNVCNQFNLMSGLTDEKYDAKTKKMNIDLILLNQGRKVEEMIELKETNNNENPLYAMFQLIFYYSIYLKCIDKYEYPDVASALKLTILAPKDYYLKHIGTENNKILNEISDIVTELIQRRPRKRVCILFQNLDINKEYLEGILNSLKANLELFKTIFVGRKPVR